MMTPLEFSNMRFRKGMFFMVDGNPPVMPMIAVDFGLEMFGTQMYPTEPNVPDMLDDEIRWFKVSRCAIIKEKKFTHDASAAAEFSQMMRKQRG